MKGWLQCTTLQVDALRAKLAAAEKAAIEAGRKEAELTAQVSVLMTSMAATQQQHAKVCVLSAAALTAPLQL